MCRICTHPRQRRPNSQREAEPFFSNQRLYFTRDVEHERSELERLSVNFQAPSSHFRQIQHLVNESGARMRVTVEIQAELPQGASESTQRTVTENCAALRFGRSGFESE